MCDKSMATVPTLAVTGSNEPLRLDLCTSCQFVWFDPTEHEAWLRSTSLAATDERLPAETRAALARLPHTESPESVIAVTRDDPPFFEWVPLGESLELKYLICILGYPVEVEPPPLHGRPWATWTLIGLVTAVSVYALLFMPKAPLEWGFIPAEMWRHGGMTLLTSFFLHGNPFHLIGNMYFLAVFGDNVEDLLGWGRYLGLLLMATGVRRAHGRGFRRIDHLVPEPAPRARARPQHGQRRKALTPSAPYFPGGLFWPRTVVRMR
jgi:hypothetical protein